MNERGVNEVPNELLSEFFYRLQVLEQGSRYDHTRDGVEKLAYLVT